MESPAAASSPQRPRDADSFIKDVRSLPLSSCAFSRYLLSLQGKIVVQFKNTYVSRAHDVFLFLSFFLSPLASGNAPQLKQKKFKLSTKVQWQYVVDFLRKQLRLKPEESLFLFINSSFQPNPSANVDQLFRCFHDAGRLTVNYCRQEAWG